MKKMMIWRKMKKMLIWRKMTPDRGECDDLPLVLLPLFCLVVLEEPQCPCILQIITIEQYLVTNETISHVSQWAGRTKSFFDRIVPANLKSFINLRLLRSQTLTASEIRCTCEDSCHDRDLPGGDV